MNIHKEIEKLIDQCIYEDIGGGDITSLACISEDAYATGKFLIKQSCVLAGLPLLQILFKKLHPETKVELFVEEGSFQKAGTIIGTVSGPLRAILSGERAALSLIQHASGVATFTSAYVQKVSGLKCAIIDTRKTLPGLRSLEKYAVAVGGGKNHRYGLDDRFVIKNNHLAFLKYRSENPILEAAKLVKNYQSGIPYEIEINDMELVPFALKTDAEVIMLRHMTPDEIETCVGLIKKANKKVYLEASGSITLETVRIYAKTGVDGICISEITNSARPVDISMKINHEHAQYSMKALQDKAGSTHC